MRTTKSKMTGWTKIGPRHYRHDHTKVEVRNPYKIYWEIVGGKSDGHCYSFLWMAMQQAVAPKTA